MSIEQLKLLLKSEKIDFDTEFQFCATRKWKADIIIAGYPLLIEYEGIMSRKSRHLTIGGFIEDCFKYNRAVAEGYSVLRYTVEHLKNPDNIIKEIRECLKRYEEIKKSRKEEDYPLEAALESFKTLAESEEIEQIMKDAYEY